jgi:hypothetical protein
MVIFDGKGYWVGMRRPERGRIVHLWSPKKEDAAHFHFYEVAQKIASTIPQKVTIKASPNAAVGSQAK